MINLLLFLCIGLVIILGIFYNWIYCPKWKKSSNLEPKDPMDWTLTLNSRAWQIDNYCPTCKARVGRDERMASICNKCGSYERWLLIQECRSFRQIWNGEKWVWQYKFQNESKISERNLHD